MTATTNELRGEPDAEQPTVLVVDDEEQVADLYADHLRDACDVTTTYGGDEALEVIDSSFDAVLLDRRMPDRTGDEVLAELRSRNLECQVAMVTAVEPDVDIIDLPFQDYLVKPVSGDEVRATVERLLLRAEFSDVEYELGSLQVKRNVLAAELSDRELRESDEFVRLQERIADLRERLSDLRERLDDDAGTHGVA
jgi:DNA-binding response OmpR family regulator